jgi:hypothetical protein
MQDNNHAAMAGTAMKKRKPPTDTAQNRRSVNGLSAASNDEMIFKARPRLLKLGGRVNSLRQRPAADGRDVALFERTAGTNRRQMPRLRLRPWTEAERHR